MDELPATTLRIERMAHGGHAVAHDADGRVVFVRHALPGELVETTPLAVAHERYSFADTKTVLEPSGERAVPRCPIADRCGGCDFQQVKLPTQRRIKAEIVAELLDRAGISHPEFCVEAVPGDRDGFQWRTRMDYQMRDGAVGMFAYHTREVVPLPAQGCCLAAPGGPETDELAEFAASGTATRSLRVAVGSDAVSVLADGRVVRGPKKLTQHVLGRDYRVAAAGFWQVHPGAAQVFAETVLEGLDPKSGESAIDLYCGSGLFSGALATRGVQVIGIDSAPSAIASAKRNVPEARFYCERVEHARLTGPVDVVVLDPSRAGAKRDVVLKVVDLRPRRIAYVACDPAALARDLKYFSDFGYRLSDIRAFDTFPMTHHIETVAILEPQV